VSPVTCPPEHLAKQQARPGFLERHRQSLMVDEGALEQFDRRGPFATYESPHDR
jgi:hypothetical protein